jgi:uracil-DNA glycosylase family 4
MTDDVRRDLAKLASSLRAYIEWQQEAGTVGFPKRPPGQAPAVPAAPREPAPAPVASEAAPSPAASREPDPAATASREHVPAAAAASPGHVPAAAASPAPAPGPSAAARQDAPGPAPDRNVRLPQLATEVASCTKCGLAATRTQTVFARGNPEAQLCFVGEAPGADEDAQGLPFVGRAGQLLDRMIGAMGLSPERDVYICNILKCRPPGNRRPEPEEMATCIPYLHEQLALVRPRAIVAMGNTAVAALLDTKLGITKLRGQWKLYRGHTLVMPTYHPSYLLRPSPQQTEAKRQAWQDLQLVMKELGLQTRP